MIGGNMDFIFGLDYHSILYLLAIMIFVNLLLFIFKIKLSSIVFLNVISLFVVFIEPAPSDVLFASLVVFGLRDRLFTLEKYYRMKWIIWFIASYILVATISMLHITDYPAGFRFWGITVYLAVYTMFIYFYSNEKNYSQILLAYVLGSTIAAIIGIMGYTGVFSEYLLFDQYRVKSLFKDPNVFGAFLIPSILILVGDIKSRWLFSRESTKKFEKIAFGLIYIILITINAAGLVISFSRGAWVALVCSVVVILLLNFRKIGYKRTMIIDDFSNFCEKKHRNFYREIALDQNLSFKPWVYALMLGERIIAFSYEFQCNTNHITHRAAHDNDFSIYGPGKILLKEVIKDCFKNGMKVFDFGLGYARYKAEWADDNRYIREVVFSTDSVLSKIIYSKYFLRKRLIEILKKYKCYDHIKVNTFGKVKYFISGGYFKEFNEAIANVGHRNLKELIRNTLSRGLESIYSVKEYTMFEKILDKSVLQEDIGTIAPTKRKGGILREEIDGKSCSDSIYEANLDDLDFLCQTGNEESSQIVRRFYKKQRCFVASHEGKIIQYAWVDTKEMGIPDIKYKEKMEAKKAFIYLYIKAENNRDIDISIQIINYINNLLYKNNFNKSSICINSKNPTLNKCLMKAGFQPTQKIKSIKVLSVSKIKTI